MLITINIFMIPILYLDLPKGEAMNWEYVKFTNLYGALTCIILGFMDKPKLENRILVILLVLSLLVMFVPVFPENSSIKVHAGYLLFGGIIGRKLLVVVDLALTPKNKTSIKN
jgi:hypothetical protein